MLLPRPLYRALLRVVVPAESAVRRLIVIVAARLKQSRRKPEPVSRPGLPSGKDGVRPDFSAFKRNPDRVPAFRLIDPRKRFTASRPGPPKPGFEPRISLFHRPPPLAPVALPARSSSSGLTRGSIPEASATHPNAARPCVDALSGMDPMVKPWDDERGGDDHGVWDDERGRNSEPMADATTLIRRMQALEHALKTLPRQARRLNRMMARRAAAAAAGASGARCVGPVRLGRPPGHVKRPRGPADDLLRELHALARDCHDPPGSVPGWAR